MDTDNYEYSSLKRKRLTQACDCCRKMKVRCDATKPSCSTCYRLNTPCTFLTRNKRRGPRQNLMDAFGFLSGVSGNFQQTVLKMDGGKIIEVTSSMAAGEGNEMEAILHEEQPSQSSQGRSERLGKTPEVDVKVDSKSELSAQDHNFSLLSPPSEVNELSPLRTPKTFQQTSYLCSPNKPSITPDVELETKNILIPQNHNSSLRTSHPEENQLPSLRSQKEFQDSIYFHSHSESSVTPESEETLRKFDPESRLVATFFDYIHIHIPIVHQATFMRRYHEGKVESTLMDSICALASRYQPQTCEDPSDSIYSKRFEDKIFSCCENTSVEVIQALLLMSMYEISYGRQNRSCVYIGKCIYLILYNTCYVSREIKLQSIL
ncbi:hypothetical protein K7432_006395 [Basidiobolus ranarum]|uniref:Zn(2)-C6 fungal-type domain-containing protein n=1 Tax=Basidiobolus ranarum TaxID=34480 RepID=A0ABR2WV07_9FUNG